MFHMWILGSVGMRIYNSRIITWPCVNVPENAKEFAQQRISPLNIQTFLNIQWNDVLIKPMTNWKYHEWTTNLIQQLKMLAQRIGRVGLAHPCDHVWLKGSWGLMPSILREKLTKYCRLEKDQNSKYSSQWVWPWHHSKAEKLQVESVLNGVLRKGHKTFRHKEVHHVIFHKKILEMIYQSIDWVQWIIIHNRREKRWDNRSLSIKTPTKSPKQKLLH